jgi:acetyl-CoA synthetase
MARMMDAAKDGAHSNDLSSVQYIFCTGELVSKELFQQFKNTFGKQIYNNWGCQELIAAPLSWRPHQDVPLEKVGSVGKTPWIRAEVKITDENGNQVADGVPGEIMFRTPSHFLGYWHEPQESTRKFVEGWYKPGDSFVRDKDGYYWYHGRLDDMVKIAGRQIFPVEIEQVIGRHRAVLENAVLPMENELSLSELEAFVVVREGYTPSAELATEIQTLVKNELAPFKRPQRVEFVSGLPRTGTGKVQRFRLKEQMLEARKKRK